MSKNILSTTQISEVYQQACEIELQAFKPGNVSVYAEGHDMSVEDFRLSAKASAKPLCNPEYSLGEKIYYAVKETRKVVACNTNLGILLLCAPVIQAIEKLGTKTLRQSLENVLNTTTKEDADWVFRAITLASPGGLGKSKEADVSESAKITLLDAMEIAKSRDRIALQYTNSYKDIFDFAILRYNGGLNRWGSMNWSAVLVYAALLSRYPDSHIERKYGNKYTRMVQNQMVLLNDALLNSENPERLKEMLFDIDSKFKVSRINPGTSADLTVATIFIFLVQKLLE